MNTNTIFKWLGLLFVVLGAVVVASGFVDIIKESGAVSSSSFAGIPNPCCQISLCLSLTSPRLG